MLHAGYSLMAAQHVGSLSMFNAPPPVVPGRISKRGKIFCSYGLEVYLQRLLLPFQLQGHPPREDCMGISGLHLTTLAKIKDFFLFGAL